MRGLSLYLPKFKLIFDDNDNMFLQVLKLDESFDNSAIFGAG